MKLFLRRGVLSAHINLQSESHADYGQWIEKVGWAPNPRAELETYFGKVEKGCLATLNTAYAPQARAVLALCRAARDECLGEYVSPVRAALVAATLAQAYEEHLTTVLLERPVPVGGEALADRRKGASAKHGRKKQHDAERLFYRQRFEHYAGRLPDQSMRSLRRLASIDAKNAGWPQRKDSTYAAWTLDLRQVRRMTKTNSVVGTAPGSA